MRKPRKKKQDIAVPDYIFTFKFCKFNVTVDEEVVSEEEKNRILDIISVISNEISIDKSFVEYEGTKYTKNFLNESGWKELCSLVQKTDFGKNATKKELDILFITYKTMIQCYVFMFLYELDVDLDAVFVELSDKDKFLSIVQVDNYREWERYPGRWQTWTDDFQKKISG